MPYPPVILKPHEPVAERVLLPGDPGRALRLATQLIDGPRMLNHHRGLWGYSGPAADGAPLTIQSTGLGGPSAAAVVAELIALGARRLVRVGTAAALGATPLGALVVAEAVLAVDGASRALGAGERVAADAALTRALDAPLARARRVGRHPRPGARGRVGATRARSPATSRPRRCWRPRRGAAPLPRAVLAVTRAGGERLGDEAVEEVEARLGAVALAALSAGADAARWTHGGIEGGPECRGVTRGA